MTGRLAGPFFEIGPKNLLRRGELELIARAAGRAGVDHGVTVVLTVPTALVTAIDELCTGVLVFAQGMDLHVAPDSLGRVSAETLADAGAAGVMLNHDSNPLSVVELELALAEAAAAGLEVIACAGTEDEARHIASLSPTAVLYEPPALIGSAGPSRRAWIPDVTAAIHSAAGPVLAMHAGGVSSAAIARSIMAAGADGTGSTSGVLLAENPSAAARAFIAATRSGWDEAQHDHQTRHLVRGAAHQQGEQR